MKVHEQIKQYLKNNKIHQNHLAERAKINEKTLSAILLGNVKLTMDRYSAICHALNVPESYFFDPKVQDSRNATA